MFEINEDALPIVRTRQALLLLDLQNDFLTTGGLLAVEEPAGFLDNILNLLPQFRQSGNNVIWIRSQFEVSRPVNGPGQDSETVILDGQKLPTHRRAGQKIRNPPQRLLDHHARIVQSNRRESGAEEGMLEADERPDTEDEFVVEETYLTIPEGQQPRVVVAASPGTNFAPRALVGFSTAEDLIFQKSYYSAFRDGALMEFMRAQFITEIFLCGSLTNISVFATAMDAARHGFAITILEDCLGYRSKARHDEALHRLTISTGCDIISSRELIGDLKHKAQEQSDRARKSAPPRKRGGDLESLMSRMKLRHTDHSSSSSSSRHSPTADTSVDLNGGEGRAMSGQMNLESGGSSESLREIPETVKLEAPVVADTRKRERVPAKIKSRRRHSKPRSSEKGTNTDHGTTHKRGVSPTSATLTGVAQALENIPPSLEGASEPGQVFRASNNHEIPITSERNPLARKVNLEPSAKPTEGIRDNTTATVAEGGDPIAQNVEPKPNSPTQESAPAAETRQETLCEGDTSVFTNLLDSKVEAGIFEKLRDEVEWKTMYHQTGEVPRLVAVQGEIRDDGSIPLYRHPSDESPPLLPFSPTVSLIRAKVEEKLGHMTNHVLIQFYRNSLDHISEHSDKTLDIVPGTYIANVSLGAHRTMLFRTKKPQSTADPGPRRSQKAPLPHNSMCKVGLTTNMRWMHEIRPDKRQTREKSAEELAFDCGRISLTFRSIGTFLTKNEEKIWGQGAVAKEKEEARYVLNGKTPESESMLKAFGIENRSSEFKWREVYGGGFDVLHMSNERRLFLSGDSISDMRVKLLLSELNLKWVLGKSSTAAHRKDGEAFDDASEGTANGSVKLIDNDVEKSTVTGDHPIMLYLEYGYAHAKGAPPKADLARQCIRLELSRVLLSRWRTISYTIDAFVRELALWEKFASEHAFIASPTISVVDFAVWPILDEISRGYNGFKNYPNLSVYYESMKNRPSVSAVIDASGGSSSTKSSKET
ncbi:Clavaminate synthase-like protein [Glarea lozoyensis ATCC 20868]|uniref:Clavaminate synthase-like protein n=1 Tax=Glarea lozoyensis (strain ATCC 20868 / MF5171) TaxID=1116229 RepID=S3DFA3_GLAL2|nr:Clavaminate synthase-like protein [Glarea lozoyensis ATCC 20868]EPE30661.1 Clavaminate synthase-like protein [Glarea lozoyensis ATCC 20868]